MTKHSGAMAGIAALALGFGLAACDVGPSSDGSFDRTISVQGPVRLELANAAGDIRITGASDGKVHIHGEVRVSSFPFGDATKRLAELTTNPPIEQSGGTVRVGRELGSLGRAMISYVIEVPRESEVTTTVASGSQTVTGIRGPLKMEAASGAIRAEKIDKGVQLTTASGDIEVDGVGDDVRVSSASGSVNIATTKGDVRVNALAGGIIVKQPGGRVDVDTASGRIEVQGATSDVRAHAASGQIMVQGNPGANNYWDLKTASGSVKISVPRGANFHLTAEAVSGEISTDIPIVVEEQGKHSVRARAGTGGGRVEIHTVSGQIVVQ